MIRYSKAPRGTGELILCAFVFFASGEAAADVALAFIQIQNLPDLGIQLRIAAGQAILQILMDGGFGDAKVVCSGADCGAGFDDVHSQSTGSLVNGVYHVAPSVAVCC